MTKRVTTSNMAEVLYLLDRNHRIVEVEVLDSVPYGIRELCVVLDGKNIDLDHNSYLAHGHVGPLTRLSVAFEAVMAVVYKEAEGKRYQGGRGMA